MYCMRPRVIHENGEQDGLDDCREACGNGPASCRRLSVFDFPPRDPVSNSHRERAEKYEPGQHRKADCQREGNCWVVDVRQEAGL